MFLGHDDERLLVELFSEKNTSSAVDYFYVMSHSSEGKCN